MAYTPAALACPSPPEPVTVTYYYEDMTEYVKMTRKDFSLLINDLTVMSDAERESFIHSFLQL